MQVKQAINKRQSIRKYKDKKIPKVLVTKLIDAARMAPSSMNLQPVKFFIVQDQKTKQLIKDNKIFKQDFVYAAPLIIICSGYHLKSDKEHTLVDIAIATQNLVLQATELGLGTCYIGWMDNKKIKKVLNIPEKYIIPYSVTVGYPDEKPKPHLKKNIKECYQICS